MEDLNQANEYESQDHHVTSAVYSLLMQPIPVVDWDWMSRNPDPEWVDPLEESDPSSSNH